MSGDVNAAAEPTLFKLEQDAKNALTNFKLGVAARLDKIARERDALVAEVEQLRGHALSEGRLADDLLAEAEQLRAERDAALSDDHRALARAYEAVCRDRDEFTRMAESELRKAREGWDGWQQKALEAEAREQRLQEALRVYADPRNWTISRDDLNHRVVSWIGPGAERKGMPNAMETAESALTATNPEHGY